MRSINGKAVLTTGQVARICHVAPRTVSKWFDSGKLRGYRIPGSRDRRIPVEQLLAFTRTHGIPLDVLDGGACRVLIVSEDLQHVRGVITELNDSDRYEIRLAANDFEAGVLAEQSHPHVIVLDVDHDLADAVANCVKIKSTPALQSAKVIAVSDNLDAGQRQKLIDHGFDDCLTRGYSAQELVGAVENATNIIT